MELNKEGTSTTKPPLLIGITNYVHWKVRMIAFLKSIDNEVWNCVEDGYTPPTIEVDGKIILKPKSEWSKEEKHASNCNSKAINGIYNGLTPSEFQRISSCATAKETWNILQTIHEGIDKVKQTKLQNLSTAFESVRMKESKTFDEFNVKLSDIVNSSFNVGEPIPESKVVKKILRSLPSRFITKVVAIEETKDLDTLKLDELVGDLQTYEANHMPTTKPKGIALVSTKAEGEESDDETESNSDNEDFEALFVKKVHEIFEQEQEWNEGNLSEEQGTE